MNSALDEKLLKNALEILAKDNFEHEVLALMAKSGMKILDLDEDGHMEMEIAFWTAFTSVMLSPFDKDDYSRVLQRYATFVEAIFNEAADLPLPEGYDASSEQAPAEPEK